MRLSKMYKRMRMKLMVKCSRKSWPLIKLNRETCYRSMVRAINSAISRGGARFVFESGLADRYQKEVSNWVRGNLRLFLLKFFFGSLSTSAGNRSVVSSENIFKQKRKLWCCNETHWGWILRRNFTLQGDFCYLECLSSEIAGRIENKFDETFRVKRVPEK